MRYIISIAVLVSVLVPAYSFGISIISESSSQSTTGMLQAPGGHSVSSAESSAEVKINTVVHGNSGSSTIYTRIETNQNGVRRIEESKKNYAGATIVVRVATSTGEVRSIPVSKKAVVPPRGTQSRGEPQSQIATATVSVTEQTVLIAPALQRPRAHPYFSFGSATGSVSIDVASFFHTIFSSVWNFIVGR